MGATAVVFTERGATASRQAGVALSLTLEFTRPCLKLQGPANLKPLQFGRGLDLVTESAGEPPLGHLTTLQVVCP